MYNEVQEGAELLAEVIRDDPDYRAFQELTETLRQDPELSARLHAFRKRNYELQNISPDPESEMWDMNQEYQNLTRNPLVCAYFEAEAGVCRMMQEIMNRIYTEISYPEL